MQQALSLQLCTLDPKQEIYRMCVIGSGKFGTVYKGYDKLNSRMVALKYVSSTKDQTWKKEITALQNFDHPNIIKYYGYIPEKNQNSEAIAGVYIVTEFVRGKTLEEYIASTQKVYEKGLPESLVFKLFSQLLEGYSCIHSKNFLHRDIKPQNILVDENENIKIIDFGQSKQRKLLKTKGLGTPLYSAPENFSDKIPADFRRDVWSLGLVLYEMITGRCYFEKWKQCSDEGLFKKYLQHHKIQINFPKSFHPFWTQIVKKMLCKDYTKRVNLHEIQLLLGTLRPEFQKKFKLCRPLVVSNLSASIASGNTNPITQSQNQFQFSWTKGYLKFFYDKHKFLVLLSDFFRRFSYPFLSNAHKYILVFISFNIYVVAIDHLLKRLSNETIKITDNQIFDIKDFEEPYQSAMRTHLQIYREYYQKQSRLTKDVILEKILPKFSAPEQRSSTESESSIGTSSSRKQKEIQACELVQKYPQVKVMIQNFKEGLNSAKKHYIEKFNEVVFSEEYHHSDDQIRQYFYQEDMLVYYLILIICNIDELLAWNGDYLGNELPKLREELENNKRDEYQVKELLAKIKKYNSKN